MDARIDHEGDVRLRVRLPERLDHGESRIARILDTADQLNQAGIVLAQKALQIVLEPRLLTAERLQQGQGRRILGRGRSEARQPPSDQACGQCIDGSHEAQDQDGGAEEMDQGHPGRSAFPPRSSSAGALWQGGRLASPSP